MKFIAITAIPYLRVFSDEILPKYLAIFGQKIFKYYSDSAIDNKIFEYSLQYCHELSTSANGT